MDAPLKNQRKSPRIDFSIQEQFPGEASTADRTAPSIPVVLLSMSEGGISFQCDEVMSGNLSEGLVLAIRMGKPCPIFFLDGALCEVRYVLHNREGGQATIGCRFRKLRGTAEEEIKKFLSFRLEKK